MQILQGPGSSQSDELARQVAKDKKAKLMETHSKYFHPRGREHFSQEHGHDYQGIITPYEEALHKFSIKQRSVREAALKKSLSHKVSN